MTDTFTLVQRLLFFGLLIGITLAFLWMLSDFLMPLFWAVVLAVVLHPIFHQLRDRLRGNAVLASLLTILFALIVVFLPLFIIGRIVAGEAIDAYLFLANENFSLSAVPDNIPFVSEIVNALSSGTLTIGEHITEFVRSVSTWLATQAVSIGANTLNFGLKFVLMLYVLFFLLKDGERLGSYFLHMLPLGNIKEHVLFGRFTSTTRAIIKGTLIVAIVQGLIGALLFFIAGVPSPVLWGVMMALLALIPAVGPSIVWAPAGIILLLMGNIVGAIVILAGGAIVISLIDNILRPILVGKDTEMPDALILLAIFGGIATFGIAGIVIGPVIAALFLSIWDLFAKEYATELEERG